MKKEYKLGLALSGGGYRAAAFHLGTLNKLQEMNLLSDVDVLSTISGGSITGAYYCLHRSDYDSFRRDIREKVIRKNIISYILTSWVFIRTAIFLLLFIIGGFWLTLTCWSPFAYPVLILLFFFILKFQYRLFPVSKVIERAYDKYYYNGSTLSQLKEKPLLAIGSSNLHTGRPFTFSREKMGDSNYAFDKETPVTFRHGQFPVARAVMASSCVPFAFSPVAIAKKYFVNKADAEKVKPVLVDGGVYDNQGIHKLTQKDSMYECDIIITSDAGGNFKADKKYPNVILLLVRTVDLFMYRIKAAQMIQNIYRNQAAKPIAYFSLGWDLHRSIPGFIENMEKKQVLSSVMQLHELQPQWIAEPAKYKDQIQQHLEQRVGYDAIKNRDLDEADMKLARSTGTNLTTLSEHRVDCLVRHAENLTELQVKLYCPQLF